MQLEKLRDMHHKPAAILSAILFMMLLPSVSRAVDWNVAVLRIQFRDVEFTGTEEQATALMERCSEYFNDQFRGESAFNFALSPVITLDGKIDTYGQNTLTETDYMVCDAIREACRKVDDEMDFSGYDCLIALMAGPSEADGAGTGFFWPSSGRLEDNGGAITLDGKVFNDYSVCTEINGGEAFCAAGSLCHEFAHILGLKDIYDTDGESSGGTSPAMWGSTALMDKGGRNGGGWTPAGFNALDMELLGIGSPETLKPGSVMLDPLGASGRYLKASAGGPDEFYLIECRDSIGWDRHIGGAGLLVYHIDRSNSDSGVSDLYGPLTAARRWELNQVNCNPDFQCASLFTALPDAEDVSGVFWPQEGRDCIGAEGAELIDNKGMKLPFALADIRFTGGNASFTVLEPIRIGDISSFQNSAIVNWEVDSLMRDGRECVLMLADGADTLGVYNVAPRADSVFTISIDGLEPGKGYSVRVSAEYGENRFHQSAQFKTKTYISGTYPFIKLPVEGRNEDGSFMPGARIPLKVDNAPGKEVLWSFNGEAISTGPDGYYILEGSGTLKAEIDCGRGKVDTIIKEISVK